MNTTTPTEPSLYLVRVSTVWFPYGSSIGGRTLSKDAVADHWRTAYPEHASTITVIDAPAADADGQPFRTAWGWSYKETPAGFVVHAKGR